MHDVKYSLLSHKKPKPNKTKKQTLTYSCKICYSSDSFCNLLFFLVYFIVYRIHTIVFSFSCALFKDFLRYISCRRWEELPLLKKSSSSLPYSPARFIFLNEFWPIASNLTTMSSSYILLSFKFLDLKGIL